MALYVACLVLVAGLALYAVFRKRKAPEESVSGQATAEQPASEPAAVAAAERPSAEQETPPPPPPAPAATAEVAVTRTPAEPAPEQPQPQEPTRFLSAADKAAYVASKKEAAERAAGRGRRRRGEVAWDTAAISRCAVVVETDASRASGFLCELHGTNYIFTNAHVFEGSKSFKFSTVDIERFAAYRLDLADDCDLARIHIEETNAPALKVAAASPSIDDPIALCGNSGGAGVITMQKGKVLGVGPAVLEVSAEFVGGNSGSPIVNRDGAVVGVATYLVRQGASSWQTAGTRFEKTRRFGTRLTERQRWVEVPARQFLRATHVLADAETFLVDCREIYEGLGRANLGAIRGAFRKVAGRQRTEGKSARYHDPAYSKLLTDFCENFLRAVKTATGRRRMSVKSSSFRVPLHNASLAFRAFPDLPMGKLKKTSWPTSFYRERAKEYYDVYAEVKGIITAGDQGH